MTMQTYDSPGAAPRQAAYVAKPRGLIAAAQKKKTKQPRKANAKNVR